MGKDRVLGTAAATFTVCLTTWLTLAITAGDLGLQRSISKGAVSLFEIPIVIIGVASVAFVVGCLTSMRLGIGSLQLLFGVLIGDLFAGVVLAPIAIGELEPIHAP